MSVAERWRDWERIVVSISIRGGLSSEYGFCWRLRSSPKSPADRGLDKALPRVVGSLFWLSALVGAEVGDWKELREKEPRWEDPREGAEGLKESRKSLVDFEGERVPGGWGLESVGPFKSGS